jgi:hypothetical protein
LSTKYLQDYSYNKVDERVTYVAVLRSKLVTEAGEVIENPEEGERPPLEPDTQATAREE